jgi:hypothetical protein
MNNMTKAGFTYTVEAFDKHGNPVGEKEVVTNKMPTEFLNYMLNAAHKGGTQFTSWYVGLYSGNYTPTGSETMVDLPTQANEFTGYGGALRPLVTFGTASGGRIDNSGALIELTFEQDVAVRGGFITSGSAKGGTSGLCASVVKFTSPKQPGVGGVLRIAVGQELIG